MKYLSTFSGIGGFELGIELAYESLRDADGSTERRSKTDTPSDQDQGLLTTPREDTSTTQRPTSERTADCSHQRPLCIGYSEIDKYATSIYQKHFPTHHNYGDITTIDPDQLPDFDLLVGGFPCQAFSIAGKRGGFEDTRGTMFFELARILRAKQPQLFVFENVKGLLSHDSGNTFKTIIASLTELGYDCQWQVLNSKNHGVPQNRERVFIVGHLRGTPRPKVFPIAGADSKDIEQLNQPIHSNDRVYGTGGIAPTLNTMQGGRRQPFIVAERGRYEPDGTTKQRFEARKDNLTNTLTSVEKDNRVFDDRIRRLTPTECERLQGFPDGWTEGVSDTQRYKTLGNAVTVNVIRDIFRHVL